jgi:hypothetical protein
MSQRRSVNIVTRIWAGRPGSDSRQAQGLFLVVTASRPALGPNQPPSSGYLWIFAGVKLPGSETDHLPPSGTEVKNVWIYTSTPPYVFMACHLVKQKQLCSS